MTLTTTIPTAPAPLRPFLQYIADRSANDNQRHSPAPRLFATHTARDGTRRRVRCVTASRLGRVGITERLADDTTPQEYVPAGSLSQFLPTPYPRCETDKQRAQRISVHSIRVEARAEAAMRVAAMLDDIALGKCDIRKRVASAAGVTVADITGTAKHGLLINSRRGVIGAMAANNCDATLNMLGRCLGVAHTTVLHHLKTIGLHDQVALFDLPHLRALWRRGRMTVGYEPGQMPTEVARRLAQFVNVIGDSVEPATWAEFRVFLGRRIGDARIAEMREQMKCAA